MGLVVVGLNDICCVGHSSGRFGACFLPGLCKQSDLQVFAARPGLRLWRSDIRGQVEDTRLLRPLFSTQVDWEYWECTIHTFCTGAITVAVIRNFFWGHMIQIREPVLLLMLLLPYLFVLGQRQLYVVYWSRRCLVVSTHPLDKLHFLCVPTSLTQTPQFELFPRPDPIGAYRPADRQLGLLSCFLREGWLLSWNEYSIYVLDCLNEVGQLFVISC